MKTTAYLIGISLLCLSFSASAQDEGFIYGKVYMYDDRVYEGPIRWGKEEVYWIDIFNAGKEKNPNLKFLSSRERDDLERRQSEWGYWGSSFWTKWVGADWGNGNGDFTHQFSCQFGELKSIEPDGRKYVNVELQNGTKFSLLGEGYNDVGLEIRIMDKEMGQVEVEWSRIEKVEFIKTPKRIENKFGNPLYGTVEAYGKKFTGYIQWDHDERISTDKLDGDSEDGDLSIEMGKIKSIERAGGRSLVVLKSGRELRMDGSNDVSSGHRGVIVMNNDFPSIDIPWDEFDKVTFTEFIGSPGITYDDFKQQKALTGTITTQDGKTLSGKIVYDLDEEFQHELLQGKNNDFEYTIPFHRIKRIEQASLNRCLVELKSGEKLSLTDTQDVNEKNQGVLVFSDAKSDPKYIPWEEVKSIDFK
jgi:hypothetical protein